MPRIAPQPLPFKEALDFFRGRRLAVSARSWRDVWASEHVHAFTVARVTALDVIEDIRSAVDRAIEEGTSLERFKSDLSDTLERKGWLARTAADAERAIAPWRLDTIYRTNIQAAYQAGRYRQMVEAASLRPYWMYDSVGDGRTRPLHGSQNGKIYPFDHPFWETWYPPNGFRCRCTVRALSERALKRRRLQPSLETTRLKPDEGFHYNPGMVRWAPDLRKYGPKTLRHLHREGIGAPLGLEQLEQKITLFRDGYRTSGIHASRKPLRIVPMQSPSSHGWTRIETGEIALQEDILSDIRQTLEQGAAKTTRQIEAFQTLLHELGHHLGKEINPAGYAKDAAYRALVEAVNDLWARHNLAGFLRTLDIRFDAGKAAAVFDTQLRSTQAWYLRSVLRLLELDNAAEKALVEDLNLEEDPENLSDRLWNIVRAKKPHLHAWGHFGETLIDPAGWVRLLDLLKK